MNLENYINWIFTRFRSQNPSKFFASPERSHPSEPVPSPAVVFHWGENATVDYFFRAPIVLGYPIISHVDTKLGVFAAEYHPSQVLIVVRYLSDHLLLILKQHKRNGGRIIFFMDDDLPHNLFDWHIPHAHRKKLMLQFGRFFTQIDQLADELWVSTPALAARYAHAKPKIVPALALPASSSKEYVTFFYHGHPSTHREDIKWLQAVVAQVQAQCANTLFMIVGDRQVRQLYGTIPRTIILHPMPWPTYFNTLGALPHHIGLAALRPTKFNANRSPTRFYDFTRLGAVGLFSDTPPYRGFIRDGIDGWLLPGEPIIWSDKIIQLAQDFDLRQRVLTAAQTRASLQVQETNQTLNSDT